jgi:nucleotide-binding universal stress UspA family protein
MKNVLIALDYDPTAQRVAELGYKLAKTMQAHVTLLHVLSDTMYYASREYSPVMGFTGYADIKQQLLSSPEVLKKESLNFLSKSKEHLGDKTIKTIVKLGDFADTILNVAKETDASLIVLGSHSRKWLDNVLMGSVTEKVLHHTSIPLFIIPTKKTQPT